MVAALAILLTYLWGAIPTAYLAARYLRGIDIRQYGSGNVGAANVAAHLGVRVGLLLGAFDCVVKGIVPVLAVKALGFSPPVQAGVGLAAVAGHNWSPYIGFSGGRGIATAGGVLIALPLPSLPWEVLGAALVGGGGWAITRSSALWVGLGVLLIPLWAYLLREGTTAIAFAGALVALLAMKRLTANWRRPPAGEPWPRVLFYRLAYDRDIPDRDAWMFRKPKAGQGP